MLLDKLLAAVLALATGLIISCLGPVNGALQVRTGLWPMLAVVHLLGLSVALTGGLLFPSEGVLTATPLLCPLLAVMLALSLIALGLLSRQALLIGTPLFALLGGALGLLVVLGTVFAITKLGVLSGLLLVILAELLGAALIDSFGLLGRPRLPLDLARLGGIGLVLMGALLTLRKAG